MFHAIDVTSFPGSGRIEKKRLVLGSWLHTPTPRTSPRPKNCCLNSFMFWVRIERLHEAHMGRRFSMFVPPPCARAAIWPQWKVHTDMFSLSQHMHFPSPLPFALANVLVPYFHPYPLGNVGTWWVYDDRGIQGYRCTVHPVKKDVFLDLHRELNDGIAIGWARFALCAVQVSAHGPLVVGHVTTTGAGVI